MNEAQKEIANWLWNKFDYFLPIPPGQFAEKMIQMLESKGYKIEKVKENDKH